MGTELGKAFVQIVPSAQGIKGSITKVMNGESVSAGKASGLNIAGAIKGAIVAAGIGEALKKSLTEGAAIEQSLGGVETLFKDSADTVIKNADKAWETAGLSANEYMEQSTSFAASLLQSLAGDTDAAATYADMAIVDMADNANKMGTGIENIQNAYQGFAKQNYTMLDNLKLGYGGTKSEMERLLQDASAISGVDYNIDNLSDVYEAIHVIQGELGITGTTSKEAAETLSGSFAAMKSAAQNFMGNLSMRPEQVQESLSNLVSSIGTFLFKNLIPALGNVMQAIPQVIGTFMQGDFVGKLIGYIEELSGKLLTGATAFIDVGLGLLERLAQGIADGLPTLYQKIPTIINNLANIINNNAPKIITSAFKILGILGSGLIQAVPVLIRNIPRILKALFNAFLAVGWASIGRSIVRSIAGGLKGAASSFVNTAKSSIVDKLKNLFPFSVGKIFKNIKLPKIVASGGKAPWGILGQGVAPKFSVKWNKAGGIFDSASIVGYGVGEAGAEAIVPLDKFWQKMDNLANSMGSGGTMNVVINLDGKTIGQAAVDYVNGQTIMFGTSPLAI